MCNVPIADSTVLDAAMHYFWQHGYEAASMDDLAHHLGLHAQGLSERWSDKAALFDAALARYLDTGFASHMARLERGRTVRETFEALFACAAGTQTDGSNALEPVLFGRALEVAPFDNVFQQAIGEVLARAEIDLFNRITAGQRDGTFSLRVPARELARGVLGTLVGLRTLALANPAHGLLETLARSAMITLVDGVSQT